MCTVNRRVLLPGYPCMAIRAPRLTFLALYHYILQRLIKYRYNSIEYSSVEYSGVEYSGVAKDQMYNA